MSDKKWAKKQQQKEKKERYEDLKRDERDGKGEEGGRESVELDVAFFSDRTQYELISTHTAAPEQEELWLNILLFFF